MNSILETLNNIGLVPVIRIDDASKAVPLAQALIEGGLPCAEITFRTAQAADAIKAMTQSHPDMIVGAGTVINTSLAEKAVAAGARFIVSPGFNPSVVDWCIAHDVPIVPGVNNPSGVEAGLEKGLEVLKLFPAEVSGGVALLDALAGPFPTVRFMPTGGIDIHNLGDYAQRSNVLAIGGSWMVKADLIANEKWADITRLSREALVALHGFAFAHIGINEESEVAALHNASLFAHFGLYTKIGVSSVFSGSEIEISKTPGRGKMGHIAFKCRNIERALAYLKCFGFEAVEETAKREKNVLKAIYLNTDIAGFALHLIKAT